jgi:S-adenosylmethionine:tRNA-ribosyltransferase-isomerase (queuine synthetase)
MNELTLPRLNLPEFEFKIRQEGSIRFIYDEFRSKYIQLTKEEWVRQNFLKWLVKDKKYPKSRIKVEQSIKLYNQPRRCDAVVYDKNLSPQVLLEFKEPDIAINQDVLDQIGSYNFVLEVPYLIVSNGIDHYQLEYSNETGYGLMNSIADYSIL